MSEQHQNPIKKCAERGQIDTPIIIYMSAHNPDLVPALHNKKWRIKFVIEYVDQLKSGLIRHVVTAS